jgi:NADH:ubiquinone oxidoreductase subunit F (NADH-binding)
MTLGRWLGSHRIEEIFTRVAVNGHQPSTDNSEWREIVSALNWASLCGHGTGLGAFAESALRYYEKEIAACFG